ncbi:MAG: hypothetical protein LBV48_00050 [Mycoplasmataceae bacterium]|jgi:hypothetical protein|nr:hypothetical protein [Mycoplasmataceae bacterium]
MAKVRLNIELDDKAYEDYKKKFNDIKRVSPSFPVSSVEEFIALSLETLYGVDEKIAFLTKRLNFDLTDIIGKEGIDIVDIIEKTKANNDDNDDDKKESLD